MKKMLEDSKTERMRPANAFSAFERCVLLCNI